MPIHTENNATKMVPQTPSLTGVSTEIRMMIFKALDSVPEHSCRGDFDYCATARPCSGLQVASEVSKDFCFLARDILDTRLNFNDHTVERVLQLAEENKKTLTNWVKVYIAVSSGASPAWMELAPQLSNVNCLHLETSTSMKPKEIDELTHMMMYPIVDNNRLQHLTLTDGMWESIFPKLLNFTRPVETLHTLDIDFYHDPIQVGIFTDHPDGHPLDPKHRRTAPIRSLSLRNIRDSVTNFPAELLSWQSALENVYISSMLGSTHVSRILPWLAPQVDSLKKNSVYSTNRCMLSNPNDHLVLDATKFPKLKTLVWSRWQMSKDLEFVSEDAKLLGPALHTLVWDFDDWNTNKRMELSCFHFAKAEADWLAALASAATASNSPLRHIKIPFTPRRVKDGIINKNFNHPWHLMDQLRDGVMYGHIELTYNKPSFTFEEVKAELGEEHVLN